MTPRFKVKGPIRPTWSIPSFLPLQSSRYSKIKSTSLLSTTVAKNLQSKTTAFIPSSGVLAWADFPFKTSLVWFPSSSISPVKLLALKNLRYESTYCL